MKVKNFSGIRSNGNIPSESDSSEPVESSTSKLKVLIVEDDFASRKAIQMHISEYADCWITVNGKEAVKEFKDALDNGYPYDLVCLDLEMPEMNGHETLKAIREMEKEHHIYGLDIVKVILTTASSERENIIGAFREGCEAYIIKPVEKEALLEEMRKLNLINSS